jgi:hypothetical protein
MLRYSTRAVLKVTRSVSEDGKARPRLRFGLLDCDRKRLNSAVVEYRLFQCIQRFRDIDLVCLSTTELRIFTPATR